MLRIGSPKGAKLNTAIHYKRLLKEITQDLLHVAPTVLINLLCMAQLLVVVWNNMFNTQINHEGKWLNFSRFANERNRTSGTWLCVKQHERRRLYHSRFSTCQTGGTACHSPIFAKDNQSLPKHFNFTLKPRCSTIASDLKWTNNDAAQSPMYFYKTHTF